MALESTHTQDANHRATICGVATGTPDGGVALVRVSGSQAWAMVARLCEGELPPLRQARLRRLRSIDCAASGSGEEALLVVMRAPHSYTGEDVVEISLHAGAINVRQILSWLLEVGAVPAQAGEFTRRAFANGKLSLEQAEAVAAVIGAQTELELERARRLLAGELGRDVARLRDQVFAVRIEVEANLDFPEDVEAGDLQRWHTELAQVGETLQKWLAGFARTSRRQEDMRVVIAGPPNAGKSALFNALLGRRRALVSPIAGTTRDFLEAEMWLGHRRVIVIDTAGLHDSQEALEQSGIELGREQIARAAAVVWVESASAPVLDATERSRALGLTAPKIIEVESKRDLACARPQWLGVSTIDGRGLEVLVEAIATEAKAWYSREGESAWIGNARHAQMVQAAAEHLHEAVDLVKRGEALEVAAFALSCADRHLAAILGQDGLGPVGAEVLDAVFSRFCIGK